ncbi:Aste57867_15879 [Aphanomyces stellatus]|uniref:Aste57867_15879 protein n=1 Tax=Aphanomyces stellatus TaxID=120398 RepID=A0A485L440_9STRA|nr:hypothetical protein As57867_015823 [Aphanomyces stellatus]VFT92666.1 Aste57867_15879 [Aphanomyces stellatus]
MSSNQDTKEVVVARLSAWEREREIRSENKARREWVATKKQAKLQAANKAEAKPKTSATKKDAKPWKKGAEPATVESDEEIVPSQNAISSHAAEAKEQSQPTTSAFGNQYGEFKVPKKGLQQPKIHTLHHPSASPSLILPTPDVIAPDDDAESVASDATDSDDEKLTDSLELSIAMSPKKVKTKVAVTNVDYKSSSRDLPQSAKPHAFVTHQPTTEKPQMNKFYLASPSLDPLKSTRNTLPDVVRRPLPPPLRDHQEPNHSSFASTVAPAAGTKAGKIADGKGTEAPPVSTHAAKSATKAMEGSPPSRTQSIKPLAKRPTRDLAPPPAAKAVAIESKESKPTLEEVGKRRSNDSTMKGVNPSASKPTTTRVPSSPSGLTLSMEEDQLRREIASLNSKLKQDAKARDCAASPSSADETESETLVAYGGGAHHKIGTRTAPVDRCSLEKRLQMSGVHQTRVRKGPTVVVADDKPSEAKKADKVTVKKDLAFMLLS